VFLLAALMLVSTAIFADDSVQFGGYWRTGFGWNQYGGSMSGVGGLGPPANFLRLGNEAGTYGELGVVYSPQKQFKPTSKQAYYNFNLKFAFMDDAAATAENPKGSELKENGNKRAGNTKLLSREAYLAMGGLDGSRLQYWIGKRFYRESDLHMFDWFYIGDMSGVGAGVEEIVLWNALLSIAVMRESNPNYATTSNIGAPGKDVLDIRLKSKPLTETLTLDIYAAGAKVTDYKNTLGSAGDNGDTINAGTKRSDFGAYAGVKLNYDYDGDKNALSVQYGMNALEDMGLSYIAGKEDTASSAYKKNPARLRIVNDNLKKFGNFDVASGVYFEHEKTGKVSGVKNSYWGVGARPTYYFSKFYSIATEAGVQSRKASNKSKADYLSRFTIAPQIHLNMGFFSRPVLRAFVTQSFVSSGAEIGDNNDESALGVPAGRARTHLTQYGFRFETWF